jgi:hypothetical protein
LNYRPPAYQADALTGLSYRPEQGGRPRIGAAGARAKSRARTQDASIPEKRIACGDDTGSRSKGPPIERVTGKTRDSDLRDASLIPRKGWATVRIDPDLVAGSASRALRWLPRKEVIQPQVPLRLPCYDFTPITTQTLSASLPCGLGQRFLVQAAFVV